MGSSEWASSNTEGQPEAQRGEGTCTGSHGPHEAAPAAGPGELDPALSCDAGRPPLCALFPAALGEVGQGSPHARTSWGHLSLGLQHPLADWSQGRPWNRSHVPGGSAFPLETLCCPLVAAKDSNFLCKELPLRGWPEPISTISPLPLCDPQVCPDPPGGHTSFSNGPPRKKKKKRRKSKKYSHVEKSPDLKRAGLHSRLCALNRGMSPS